MRNGAYIFIIGCMACLAAMGCKGDRPDGKAQDKDSLPMLVMQIQKCSRLYTTEYRVHKIVTFDDVVRLRGKMFAKNYNMELPLGDRKVAIPMDATLKAYIDFSEFTDENVRRQEDGKIVITLPDPHIMLTDSKIDQEGIREYVSLTRAHFSDRELSAYEKQGRDAIIAHIPSMGIVEGARESAARQLVPLVVSMGFREQDVVVEFRRDLDHNNIRTLLSPNTLER